MIDRSSQVENRFKVGNILGTRQLLIRWNRTSKLTNHSRGTEKCMQRGINNNQREFCTGHTELGDYYADRAIKILLPDLLSG
jgi:hypothetical protein